VSVRLSEHEVAALDALRGGLSRSDWFRSKIGNPVRSAPRTLGVAATPAPTNAQTVPVIAPVIETLIQRGSAITSRPE